METVKSPPHGLTSIDELEQPGVMSQQSKTLVEIKVVVGIIPGMKVVVLGITGNYLRNCYQLGIIGLYGVKWDSVGICGVTNSNLVIER